MRDMFDQLLDVLARLGRAVEYGPFGIGRALVRLSGKRMKPSQSFNVTMFAWLIVFVVLFFLVSSLWAQASPPIREWFVATILFGLVSLLFGFALR